MINRRTARAKPVQVGEIRVTPVVAKQRISLASGRVAFTSTRPVALEVRSRSGDTNTVKIPDPLRLARWVAAAVTLVFLMGGKKHD